VRCVEVLNVREVSCRLARQMLNDTPPNLSTKPYTLNPEPREISYKQEAEAAKRFQKQFADKEWIKVLDPAKQ
jgi:hypothetical protein